MTTTLEYTPVAGARDLRGQTRRARPVIVILLLFVILVGWIATQERSSDLTPMSINNRTDNGTRAVAQVLRHQGVNVSQISALSSARIRSPHDTTLVVVFSARLVDYQIDSIAEYPGPVVFIDSSDGAGRVIDSSIMDQPTSEPGVRSAQCAHPDARVAGTIEVTEWALRVPSDVEAWTCFPASSSSYAFVEATVDGRTVTIISAYEIFTNAQLTHEGNAALAMRVLGRQPNLVWYVASGWDGSTVTWFEPGQPSGGNGGDDIPINAGDQSQRDFLPPGTTTVLFMLAVTAMTFAFFRARRFGALVPEPLPVIVPSSEATRGRARLYRRARAVGRASAALRAAAALRMSRRLGVARASEPDTLVDAIARATGRSRDKVRDVLFGPIPTSEAAMHSLITELDTIESEVHRP